MKREIIEGNKAIMLFDGWIKKTGYTLDPDHNGGKNDYVFYTKDGIDVREENIGWDIVYHQSWNALMPVVEKIIQLPDVRVSTNSWLVTIIADVSKIKSWQVSSMDYLESSGATMIGAYYYAVVEFIQLYNKNSLLP